MSHFVFLTTEGYTFQPDSESSEPNIENCQLLGKSTGTTAREAFFKLLKENSCLTNTSFDQVFCYKLADDHEESKEYFYISDSRKPEEDKG